MGMPRASRTSAEPHEEVTARLPCLATLAPAAAATRAAAVEMLKLPLASPPVPQVSTSASCSTLSSGSMFAAVRRVSGEAGDLGCGLAAASQSAEQGGEFDVAGLAFEDLLHEGRGVFTREGFALFDDAAELVLDGH